MSMYDLPVGRRRDDQTDLVQPASVSSAPPWDSVLERLANLERSHADLARMVTSIHEALPPEIAAATGRGLVLGSPIDAISPPIQWGAVPPITGTPPPPLPERVEAPAPPTVDPFARAFEAPDPWAAPTLMGESFFQSAQSTELAFIDPSTKPKRRLLRGRKAAKEAQARIAAEFAAPPPPPGFYSSGAPSFGDVPPPPSGFGSEGPGQDFGMPTAWSDTPVAVGPEMGHESAGPASGFAAEYATPPGWFGSAAEGPAMPPPPPAGFASDLAEPAIAETSWGTAPGGGPQSDFVFDQPAVPPPPPGFGPMGHEGISAVLPPPSGFGTDMGDAPPPPPAGFGGSGYQGLTAVPSPPSGFGTDMGDAPPPPPAGFGGSGYQGLTAVPSPPSGFGTDIGDAPPPPPPRFGAAYDHGGPPPPPGYDNQSIVTSSAEAFNDVQDVNSLVMPQAYEAPPEALEDERFLAGTGTDRTSYTSVPPITPDFFARSASRGGRR